MSAEELRRRFEQMVDEIFHQRNLDAMEKYYAPNFVIHRPWGSESLAWLQEGLGWITSHLPCFQMQHGE